MLNTYFIHYFSPECQEEIAERHQRRIIGDVVGSRYDSVMIHRNGNRISVELSDSLMQYEEQPASLIFIRNITEQNVVKEELESSLSLMKSTLESTADGILVVNEENVVVRSNQRFESIWQLPSGWQHIFDAEDIIDYLASQSRDPERFIKHMREMMSQPESAGYDQVVLKDGRVIERYATPYKIEGNYVDRRFAGKVWNFRDVTARLKTEEALRRVNEQLTETIRELENRNQEVTLLGEMGDLLHSCSSLDEAYIVVSDFAKRLFPNGSGALFILNSNRNRIEAVTSFGDMSGQAMDFPPDYCWALRRGRVHTVNSTQSDLYCRHISHLTNDDRTYICVPMIAQSETIGFLHVNGESAQTRIERLAIMVAETVAMSIANIRLRETLRLQSIRDPLTGLYNRRYMESALDLEIRRAVRYHRRVGILMIDIDRFKVFNDLYGHKTGDQLLRLFGAYLEEHSRSEDIVCRYGGEEFLIILPGAGQGDCLEKGELIRSGVQSIPIEHEGENLSFTVSIGLAVFPEEGITADIVVNAADQALYEAKNKGRNRVVSAGVTGAMSYEIKNSPQLPQ
jgi:diguanylate cyclase (GGDEF)-like protein